MTRRGEFYAGSRLLEDLVPVVGLPLDQLNFLICQVVGLLLAFPFQSLLSPKSTQPMVRLTFELVTGLLLSVFCFGHQVWYLLGQSLVSYLLMKYGSPQWSQKAVFAYCMVYLSVAHISRQYYDYGGYTLDITGPMMIQTQKLTSLAFSLADGHRQESQLSADQKSQSIQKVPDILSFYSYMFYFHGIMCGPLSFYSDYMTFIDGSDLDQHPNPASSALSSNGHTENWSNHAGSVKDLKNTPVVIKKLLTTLICGGLMVSLPSLLCPPEGLVEEEFREKSFLQKTLYLTFYMTVIRQKYYFAWILGETVNIAAGFGFNGYDESGQPKWDRNENVRISDLEYFSTVSVCSVGSYISTLASHMRYITSIGPFTGEGFPTDASSLRTIPLCGQGPQVYLSTSLKQNIDGWNKRTNLWLRRVVYDRAPINRTLSVFAISALWHGFYPGYYLTFGTGALFTITARLVRRNIRPWFQTSEVKKHVYDAITFFFTRLCNMYMSFPFLTLELMPSLQIYMMQYFWMHLGALGLIIYFTFVAPPARSANQARKEKPVKHD